MSSHDCNDFKHEWKPDSKYTYRHNPNDDDKLQFKTDVEYFCPCGKVVKKEEGTWHD